MKKNTKADAENIRCQKLFDSAEDISDIFDNALKAGILQCFHCDDGLISRLDIGVSKTASGRMIFIPLCHECYELLHSGEDRQKRTAYRRINQKILQEVEEIRR